MSKDSLTTLMSKTNESESASRLSIICANVNGLNDTKKRGEVLLHIEKYNPDILCLCDTRLDDQQYVNLMNESNKHCYYSKTDRTARGVCILIKKSLPLSVSKIISSDTGNLVKIECKFDSNTFNLLCIYGPNEDNPNFFNDLFNLIANSNMANSIIVGDFNVTINPYMDNLHYAQVRNVLAREKLKEMMEQHGFIDVFRQLNRNKKRFTWFSESGRQRARLDMALVTNSLFPFVVDFKTLIKFRCDHCPIALHIDFSNFKRGKGYWKFNNALLSDPDYVTVVKRTLRDTCAKYLAHPIYESFHIEASEREREEFYAKGQSEIQELDYKINPNLMYEMLLNDIRNETIAYSVQRRRESNERERELRARVQRLQSIRQTDRDVINLEEELRTAEIEYEQFIEERNIQNTFLKDVKTIKDGERPTPYLCSLEKNWSAQKYISRLKVRREGREVILTKQREIEEEASLFYQKLFECRDDVENVGMIGQFLDEEAHSYHRISNIDANRIEGPLTESDILETLKKCKNDKAPGLTGFTYAFYKFFWTDIKTFFTNMANFSYDCRLLPDSLRRGVITLLPKGEKPTDELKNLRPVTLLPAEYKLISGSIAKRINNLLPELINVQQVGFVPGRFIGECIRTTYDTFEWAKNKQIVGMLLLIDFEKAFDSVSFAYIEKMLHFFGFGEGLVKWVTLLLNNFSACINLAGNLTTLFQILRGARQGDPIASPLFVLAIEILCIKLRNSPNISAFKIDHTDVLLSLFADDMSIFLEYNEINLRNAVAILNSFFKVSGLKIQLEKTQVIVFGAIPDGDYKLCPDIQLKWEQSFTLLGIQFDPSLNNMQLNIDKKIEEIAKTIGHWKNRFLSPIGKAVVAKTLLLSKLSHIALVLPSIDMRTIKKIEGMIYAFIWGGRDRVAREDAKKTLKKGGLNFPDILTSWKAFKLGWLRRLYSTKAVWGKIFLANLRTVFQNATINDIFFDFGTFDILQIAKNIPSNFWRETFCTLKNYQADHIKCSPTDIVLCPIWNSHFFLKNTVPCKKRQFPSLQNVTFLIDFLTKDGEYRFMEYEEFCNLYGNVNREEFISMRLVLKWAMQKVRASLADVTVERPFFPITVKVAAIGKKGCSAWSKIMRKTIDKSKNKAEKEQNWETSLGRMQGIYFWDDCYKKVKDLFYDNKLKIFYYNIVRGTLSTNRIIGKFKRNIPQTCTFCHREIETIIHLFWECQHAQTFYETTNRLVFDRYPIFESNPDRKQFLFGLRNEPIFSPGNFYIILLKRFVWIARCLKKLPTYINFQNWFKKELRVKKACYELDGRMTFLTNIRL